MFPVLCTLVSSLLFACLSPLSPASVDATAGAANPLPLPAVTATLYITHIGGGYHQVIVDGHSTAANAAVGVRVYGDDPWFDDYLFSMGVGFAHTDVGGFFNLGLVVYRSTLNEDWEGTDEIYAIAEVAGGGTRRTNTISRSF